MQWLVASDEAKASWPQGIMANQSKRDRARWDHSRLFRHAERRAGQAHYVKAHHRAVLMRQVSRLGRVQASQHTGRAAGWRHKNSARMRILVKRILKKYGYRPDLEHDAVQTVLAQAEVMLGEIAGPAVAR